MTDAAATRRPGRLKVVALSVGAIVTGVVVLVVSSSVPPTGGIDRALVGWFVVVPLVLAGPAIAGVGGALIGDRRFARLLLGGLALLSGGGVALWLVTATQQFACAPVIDRSVLVLPSIAVGLTAAGAVVVAALTSYFITQSGPARVGRLAAALVAGGAIGLAGSFLTVLVWTWLFPVVSCGGPRL